MPCARSLYAPRRGDVSLGGYRYRYGYQREGYSSRLFADFPQLETTRKSTSQGAAPRSPARRGAAHRASYGCRFRGCAGVRRTPRRWKDQSVPVHRPHCEQITGVVWAESWRRDIRNGIFRDSLFPIWAVGTENVSFPKPVSFASWPVDRSHRLSNLLLAIHPLAQFLSSVLVNNIDLIFITVAVRHMFSP